MDSSTVVAVVITVLAFGLLVLLELHSRRNKRIGAGRESPGGRDAAPDEKGG